MSGLTFSLWCRHHIFVGEIGTQLMAKYYRDVNELKCLHVFQRHRIDICSFLFIEHKVQCFSGLKKQDC